MKPEYLRRNLQRLLATRDMSQAELARQSDVSVLSLNLIMSGKVYPSLRTLCMLLNTLKVPFESLMKE